MKNWIFVLTIVGIALAGNVRAEGDGIRLGEPAYGGNGCPAGTASVTLSPDATSLSILFDEYRAEAGDPTGRRLDRKACNVSIPVHVPQGYSVSIMQVDYRGFNSLPRGGRSTFSVEYFFAGSRGLRSSRTFYGPRDEDFLITHLLEATAVTWSACGSDVILRSNSSLTAVTNLREEQTLSTVDSADVSASLVYHLKWRRC